MSHSLKSTLGIFIYLGIFILIFNSLPLNAYVTVPRSGTDTTDKMNTGGDPVDRKGLKDTQRSPEYLDDWWGRNDYYYSTYESRHHVGSLRREGFHSKSHLPSSSYPFPNTYYEDQPGYYNHSRWNYRSNRS